MKKTEKIKKKRVRQKFKTKVEKIPRKVSTSLFFNAIETTNLPVIKKHLHFIYDKYGINKSSVYNLIKNDVKITPTVWDNLMERI